MSSSSSSTRIQQMRQTLAMLDNHELPEKFQPLASSNSKQQQQRPWSIDASLMKRYQGVRETYIQQRNKKATLDEIPNFDGDSFPKNDPQQQAEEQAKLDELKLRQKQLTVDVIAAAQQVHANVVHVQSEYAVLQQRKEELRRMLEDELEAEANDDGEDDNVDGGAEEEEDDVTEEEFAAEEARLVELQRQKALLQDKLRALQSEQAEMEQDTQTLLQSEQIQHVLDEKLAQALRNNNGDNENNFEVCGQQAITKLHEENKAMSSQVEEQKAMISHFDSLRSVMEELGGIRIVSVEPKAIVAATTTTSSSDDDGNTDMEEEEELHQDDDDIDNGLTLKVQLLGRHEVEVDLQAPPQESKRNRDRLRVQDARFVTPTVLQGPVPPQGGGDAAGMQQVTLEIPPLDDLVQVAKNMPDAQGLRLVLQEALARIDTMELRVDELSLLQTEAVVLTQMGPRYTTTTGTGTNTTTTTTTSPAVTVHQQQDVACRLVDYGLMAVLRLAPDCPRRRGSVVLDQLVLADNSSNGGDVWKSSSMTKEEKEQVVDEIQKNLRERQDEFKSPVQVVQAIKERVAMAMQRQEHAFL